MKKSIKRKNKELTILQDIMETYRYPDGTLNKIAVFISTLALFLIIVLGHFVIEGIKNVSGLDKVSASEITVKEIHDYVDTNEDFTDHQKDALNSIIDEYLNNQKLYGDIQQNKDNIYTLSEVIKSASTEDKAYIDKLIVLLQSELNNNSTMNQEEINELTAQLERLRNDTRSSQENSNTELKNTIVNQEKELQTQMEKSNSEIITTIDNQGKDFQDQIDEINHKLTSNERGFQFGYDPDTGSYGYMVNGQFKPW